MTRPSLLPIDLRRALRGSMSVAAVAAGLALLPPPGQAQPAGPADTSGQAAPAAGLLVPDRVRPEDAVVAPGLPGTPAPTPGTADGGPAAAEPPALQPLGPLPPGASPVIADAIGREFEAGAATVLVGSRAYPIEPLRSFYRSRGHAALWSDPRGLTGRGAALLARLEEARQEGLDPSRYRTVRLPEAGASPETLAAADLALSMAFVRYATDLSVGRGADGRSDPDMRATPKTIDATALLLGAADAPDITAYLAGLGPQDPIYRGLKAALARYRAIEEQALWAPLPAGLTLQPGSTGPQVRTVRQVLAALGDLPASSSGSFPAGVPGSALGSPDEFVVYDDALAAAVSSFQRRHRLAVTGTINADTRQAFNVPPAQRVRQILVNLERRRWMPDDLGNPHVFVNLPDFTLNVIEDNRSVLKMNVVIGKATWPTPIFSDLIEYLEVNPHWNVPPMILKKEVLPKMRSNPGYAAASGLRVFHNGRPIDPYSVNWSATSGAGYSFRQDPGQRNALGRIKFMLPNEFAVYLHDTPSKSLFQRRVRAFSHGCVRVERPLDLAEYLLNRNGGDWNRGRIEKVIRAGKNRAIELKTPVAVHLTYFTALPDSDGLLQFSNDVYGRDTTLGRTLFASADQR